MLVIQFKGKPNESYYHTTPPQTLEFHRSSVYGTRFVDGFMLQFLDIAGC